jgi:Flp pilus assembly protein TadG
MSIAGMRHIGWSQAGSAIVELAVVVPLLVVILFGAVDFARVFYTSMSLTEAARAGTQAGETYGAADLAHVLDARVQSTATGAVAANVAGVAASAERWCQCAMDDGTFLGTPINCTAASSAPTCASGSHAVITVKVTTSKTFTTIMNVVPGLGSVALSRTATLRVAQ